MKKGHKHRKVEELEGIPEYNLNSKEFLHKSPKIIHFPISVKRIGILYMSSKTKIKPNYQ